MPSKLSRYCEAVIEAGWLGAVILVPLFFNIYSARVFEPDKLTLLRSIALVMIGAWIVKAVSEQEWRKPHDRTSLLRFPMVLPVASLAAVYLLTTALSITPRVSLVGSYQRLQGTYTTLSYLVIFAMILMHLRTRAQVDRLVTTAIIVSIPIALYALMQRNQLDPLPWGGDVVTRVAANMGNAIFVAAYLIMVTPLTLYRIVESFSAILTDEELSWADVIRASVYITIAALHVLALLYSQSRGPLLGFLAGTFTFLLIMLVRLRDSAPSRQRLSIREVATAAGALFLADMVSFLLAYLLGLLAVNQGWLPLESGSVAPQILRAAMLNGIGFLGAVVGGAATISILAALRRGWRWLWLSMILQAGLVVGFLVVFNLPESPIADWRELPYVGRIGTALSLESTTAKVRRYIWQGAVEMISPHEPIEFPDGRKDPFNPIRPLVGYGPESMYVAYNSFYPPDLAHVEKRNASPDRSHNETLDSLVITGWLGFATWQALYGSLFYLGFRWLGVIGTAMDRRWFFGLVFGSGAASGIIFWLWLGVEYVGVAFPFGEVAGLMIYLAYYALFSRPAQDESKNPHFMLLTALLAAAIAHFAEIHFGIAIAATRTYFFAYAALAVVVGYVLPLTTGGQSLTAVETESGEKARETTSHRQQRRRRRRPSAAHRSVPSAGSTWVRTALIGGLLMGLILGTLAYEFTGSPLRSDTGDLPGVPRIVWDSLTKNPQKEYATSYAALGLFSLTLLLGGALVITEGSKRAELGLDKYKEIKGLALYLGTAILVGLIYMYIQAAQLRFLSSGDAFTAGDTTMDRIRIAANLTAFILTAFYLFSFTILICLAPVLMSGRPSGAPSNTVAAIGVLLACGLVTVLLIDRTNLNVIQADIVYKQADPWDKRAMQERHPDLWQLAIQEYDHALELAPKEDFYYLWLGRAFLEQSAVMDDPVAQQQLMEVAKDKLVQARRINPLNTDHSANLARLHTRWAEIASSDVEGTAKANQALEYYSQAHNLSPNNAVIINEWAMLLAGLFGDCRGGLDKLQESLELDDQYATTYQDMGNVALTCADRAEGDERRAYYEQAVEAYLGQLKLQQCDLQAHTALGYAQSQLGLQEQAIETNISGLACVANPTLLSTVQFHRNLAILYQQVGDNTSAVIHARSAAQASGSNVASLLDAARILLSLGALDDAYQAARTLSSLELGSWSQLRDVAVLFSQVGRPAEGVSLAEQALVMAPAEQQEAITELIMALQAQVAP